MGTPKWKVTLTRQPYHSRCQRVYACWNAYREGHERKVPCMQATHSRAVACVSAIAVLLAFLLTGCAGIPSERSLIRSARDYAKGQGVDADKYSATVADRGEDYFVCFTRRAWLHAVGDHFGVFINKETGNYTLDYGR
jgi:hypothetical protein